MEWTKRSGKETREQQQQDYRQNEVLVGETGRTTKETRLRVLLKTRGRDKEHHGEKEQLERGTSKLRREGKYQGGGRSSGGGRNNDEGMRK